MADTTTPGTGRITRIIGAVVDVEFPPDAIPAMYNALKVTVQATSAGEEPHEITLEVAQHLGDNIVRTISLKPTDGLVRGTQVRDPGAPISVPVGDVTKGHVFNVTGDVLNLGPGEQLEITERWPIHPHPPGQPLHRLHRRIGLSCFNATDIRLRNARSCRQFFLRELCNLPCLQQ